VHTPPHCPAFLDAAPKLRQRYLDFLQEAISGSSTLSAVDWHHKGQKLVNDLRNEAFSLGASRAHDGSRDIYWLSQCAAIVMFAIAGPSSEIFQSLAKDVYYYECGENHLEDVQAFRAYVENRQ
jgi:hypothetical protein